MIWAALLSAIAPLADAVENEPLLAIAYSTVAAIKFGMFTFAYLTAAGGVVAAL